MFHRDKGLVSRMWKTHVEILDLLLWVNMRRKSSLLRAMPHRQLFVWNELATTDRFRRTAYTGCKAREHPQNLFCKTFLKKLKVIMTADQVGVMGGVETQMSTCVQRV